jgi:hypothetical protein
VTLLSDDEIAAVVAGGQKHWPSPLPTVPLDEAEMLRAALRGVRSLVARNLAVMVGIDYTVDDALVTLVDRVVAAKAVSVAYVAASSHPSPLRGSAGYLYLDGNSAIVDLVSGGGVHDLAAVAIADGAVLLSALADNVYRTGIVAGTGDEPALFLRSTANADRAFRVTNGVVESGTITGDGSDESFEVSSSGPWNEDKILELLTTEG